MSERTAQLDDIKRRMHRDSERYSFEIAELIREWIKPGATAREVETLAYAIEQFLR